MNPRLQRLFGDVQKLATKHLGTLLAIPVHRVFEGRLQLLGHTEPLGNGNRYELRVFHAVTETELAGSTLQYTFVVFSPTGELRARRDGHDVDNGPNLAFVEMCTDLMLHEAAIRDMLLDDLHGFWPHRRFTQLCVTTSAELDMVACFADVESLRQLALAVGRRTAAQV